jgi:hypothetical protein
MFELHWLEDGTKAHSLLQETRIPGQVQAVFQAMFQTTLTRAFATREEAAAWLNTRLEGHRCGNDCHHHDEAGTN